MGGRRGCRRFGGYGETYSHAETILFWAAGSGNRPETTPTPHQSDAASAWMSTESHPSPRTRRFQGWSIPETPSYPPRHRPGPSAALWNALVRSMRRNRDHQPAGGLVGYQSPADHVRYAAIACLTALPDDALQVVLCRRVPGTQYHSIAASCDSTNVAHCNDHAVASKRTTADALLLLVAVKPRSADTATLRHFNTPILRFCTTGILSRLGSRSSNDLRHVWFATALLTPMHEQSEPDDD